MALLLRDREATSEVAPAAGGDAGVAVPDHACPACGAGMTAGQGWCLECGTAAPGSLGGPAGWRSAFTVVGLTVLLVAAAVVASYAALTGDAERRAAAPSSGSGAPIVAAAPPGTAATPPVTAAPGATSPGVAVPPGATATPPGSSGAVPQPGVVSPSPGAKAPSGGPFVRIPGVTVPAPRGGTITPTRRGSTTPGAPSGSTPSTGTSPSAPAGSPKPAAAAPVAAVELAGDAASTYDPYKRPGAEFGPAGNAVDDDPETVWDVSTPADAQSLRVGLVIDLGRDMNLTSMKLQTPTHGFNVELYGASGKDVPADILDKRWDHLTDGRAVPDGKVFELKGRAKGAVRHVVLWFTAAPNAADPRVAIGEVSFRGSK